MCFIYYSVTGIGSIDRITYVWYADKHGDILRELGNLSVIEAYPNGEANSEAEPTSGSLLSSKSLGLIKVSTVARCNILKQKIYLRYHIFATLLQRI
jgi:hypothetical protein